MNGTIKIDVGTRFYLDTNVFIEIFEGSGPLNQRLTELLALIDEQNIPRLVTSELTLAELLVKPIERELHDLIGVYDNITITNSFMEVVPVGRHILADSALLRARNKSIKLPDAIHLTTASSAKCSYFVTAEKKLKKQPGLDVLLLSLDNVDLILNGLRNAP